MKEDLVKGMIVEKEEAHSAIGIASGPPNTAYKKPVFPEPITGT